MYLGIDLGTSGLKLVIINQQQHIVAQVNQALKVSRPKPLWSEQNPLDWWHALERAMARFRSDVPDLLRAIKGIGLSGQMHGAIAVGKNGDVLRPAILWNDGRAFKECTELEALALTSRHITGNLAMAGFTAPKLLWMSHHERELFTKIKTVFLPKDWLRLMLTGESVTEMSDASGTLWLNVAARQWSEEMLAATGLGIHHMPKLIEGSEISGNLKGELARRWGFSEHVTVAGGAGDNAAAAVGLNVLHKGRGFVSLGTSGVVFLADDSYCSSPNNAVHAFAHAIPNRWHLMSVMLSAASAITWGARSLGLSGAESLLALAQKTTLLEK
jgi:xylulokinase